MPEHQQETPMQANSEAVRIVQERDLFWAAVMFYTRLPTPRDTLHSQAVLNGSRKYFPLIGLLIGLIASIVYLISSQVFNTELSLALSMISTILATGAFHEDGFADSCDGFGGGWTKDQVLKIMKDSRVGTYATLGLISILTVKFLSLVALATTHSVIIVCSALIAGHAISRSLASIMIELFDYVQDIDQSKVKPVTEQALSKSSQIIALSFSSLALLALAVVLNNEMLAQLLLAVIISAIVALSFMAYSRHRIGGYTGDVLGGVQQLSEVTFYLSLAATLSA